MTAMAFSEFKKVFIDKVNEKKTLAGFLKLLKESICFIEAKPVEDDKNEEV